MRKYILLLSLLWVHCVARGQTGYNYRYWFDNDYSTLRQGYSATENWQVNAEIDELSESLHTIHFQVVDSKGIESVPVTRFFLKMRDASVKKAVYWFDGNRTAQRTLDQAQGEFSIDVTELSEGFHTFYYQAIGENSSLSSVISRPFLKIAVPENMRYRCWIDNDSTALVSGKLTTGPVLVDVSQISEGYHVMHVQVEDIMPSTIISKPFVKIPQIEGVEYLKCLCIVDNKLYKEENVSSLGGIVNWDFDVSRLAQGFHSMQIQVLTPSGAATSVYNAYFLRTTTNEEMADMKCVYAIDGNIFNTMAGHMENGLFHCDIDVSNLEDGLHQITYKLSNGKGVETKAQTHYFIKTPHGGPGIVEYHYWLNKNTEKKHIVKLEKRVNPFNLITLLPFEQEPLRSECFHFEIKDNKPMMYAKNDIHIRFYDASGRFTDASKQFNDYRVSQEVKPVGELLATQTFAKIAENDIRWYTMQAVPGDTVAFKLSQPATMQLFAPSGEEVFKTSESASVNWNGIHTWENGTYYLAVHDVTGSQSTMKLEYMHMDKYAVLSYTPEEVGVVEGNFYIQLFGNGYDKLTRAQLVNNGNTLTAEIIHVKDISNAILQFSFISNDSPRGNFNLVLDFADSTETKCITIENAVTIADPIFGEIVVDVASFPRVAKPYPVTIKIKNTGNVTYQFIPLYFANSINKQLESIHLLNLGLKTSKKTIDSGLKTFYKIDGLMGEDSCIVIPTIIPFMNPYQSLEYQIGFVTGPHAIFNMYAWTESPWSMRDVSMQETKKQYIYKASTTNVTCEIDPCELVANIPNSSCVCNVLWGGVSAISNSFGAINQWRNNQLKNAYGQWYEDNGVEWPYADIPLRTPGDIIEQTISECVGEIVPDDLAEIYDAIEAALEHMRNRDPQNCPTPEPHPVNPYMPGDPNDIYGYLSQAGSKFITDSVAKVNYTIEFENDTAFATAAAHSIVIKDTLDKKYFVLEEFMPTSVRIGDREVFLKETEVKTQNNVTSFVKTIDMRPEINAIAQVDGTFNSLTGIAQWTFQSLDPMTMEPTYDLMQGILPVNFDGTSGIGEVMFEIGVKQGKTDGAEIKNRASIVFDYEDAILTPTWTNIVDAVAPSSAIDNSWMVNDSTLRITAEAFDARSGVWKYEWYVQAGENAPWWKEGETDSLSFDYHIYEGIDYGFCVVATDSAGNVEQKVIHRERGFKTYGQDYEDTIVDVPADSNNDAPDAIYDLSGRKQAEPQENRVNIVGKKKILFRRNRQ